MTLLNDRPAEVGRRTRTARAHPWARRSSRWITTTDHKTIGHLYLITSFMFFLIAGAMALVIRGRAGPARACRS